MRHRGDNLSAVCSQGAGSSGGSRRCSRPILAKISSKPARTSVSRGVWVRRDSCRRKPLTHGVRLVSVSPQIYPRSSASKATKPWSTTSSRWRRPTSFMPRPSPATVRDAVMLCTSLDGGCRGSKLGCRRPPPPGWVEGIRLSDGERGWFPKSYVEEITSRSARLRNLRENIRIKCVTQKLEGED